MSGEGVGQTKKEQMQHQKQQKQAKQKKVRHLDGWALPRAAAAATHPFPSSPPPSHAHQPNPILL
jgi:hypothetical protein